MSFHPDSRLITESGFILAKNIQKEDRILTDKGRFCGISNISERDYVGNVVEVSTGHFNEKFIVTDDTHFFGCKSFSCRDHRTFCRPSCKRQYKKTDKGITYNCKRNYRDYSFSYRPVSDILPGDIFSLPVFREVNDTIVELTIDKSKDRLNRLPNKVCVTPELMRFFGYYLAEGCLSKNKVIFTFHREECEFVSDVVDLCKKYFGLKAVVSYPAEKNTSVIQIHSMGMSIFIDSIFGHYSKYKMIPNWCMYLKESFILELFRGWACGDGGFKNDCFAITTISPDMAFKMNIILMKIGIFPYTDLDKTTVGNTAYHIKIAGHQLKTFESKLGMNHPVKNRGVKVNKYSYFDGDSLWYPVKSVNRVSYKGKVYDIDMENDENPVVSFSLVRG